MLQVKFRDSDNEYKLQNFFYYKIMCFIIKLIQLLLNQYLEEEIIFSEND